MSHAAPHETPRVTAVVLTCNSLAHVDECLRSVGASSYPNLGVLVVDNGSTDGTLERIRTDFPDVEVLALGQNLGFTAGNNRGIEAALAAGADLVMLLNDDTAMDPDCIAEMVKAWRSDPGAIGMLSPVIASYHDPQREFVGAEVLPLTWGAGEIERPAGELPEVMDVQYVSGCALMASTELIREIGLLDERLFMYYEDMDWCFRCWNAGKRVVVATRARVRHKGSGLTVDDRSLNAYYYYQRNWVQHGEAVCTATNPPAPGLVFALRPVQEVQRGIERQGPGDRRRPDGRLARRRPGHQGENKNPDAGHAVAVFRLDNACPA